MRGAHTALLLAPALAACVGNPDRHTLAELHGEEPDLAEVRVDDGLDQAMLAYRAFLQQAPKSSLTPEAMRRLADLQLEKEYGIHGDGKPSELPAPKPAAPVASSEPADAPPAKLADFAADAESEREMDRRAAREEKMAARQGDDDLETPGGDKVEWSSPLEAIELYDQILATYPNYEHNDQVLYQKARAYDELGRSDEAIAVIDRLIAEYPESRYIDEVQFRRGEYYFTRRKYLDAEDSYAAVTALGVESPFYELALYKLGWTLYKQDMHEEALQQYMALLDYKVSIGYDFDQKQDESDERRIADTYRVISLSFSNLGGSEAVVDWFARSGPRSYEDRIYSQLGEFYLDKLRYNDAATVYKTFVDLHPLHRASPRFSMRMVDIYEAGGFPKLVLETKKDFAARYGLQSEYWRHFDVKESPEVLSYLQGNLKDLASHYHSVYQGLDKSSESEGEKTAAFQEARHWYGEYLASFPEGAETPAINHRLADLLLEHGDFGSAAQEYERTAYDYPAHDGAPAAGYAAIYAHRQDEKAAAGEARTIAKKEAVASTLRFVDTFPKDEHAAAVLGAAVDDLYEMKEYARAIETGHRLIDAYPEAEPAILRSAWTVVAHSCFDTGDYQQAEPAYARVLEITPDDDASRQAIVDNLAASIYKQGEQARDAGDYRTAADQFLRIAHTVPMSAIRPVAEYDAAGALIQLEDWAGAAEVLEAFRKAYPDHELHRDATKQIAFVYRQQGDPGRAAREYERVSSEADDPALQREALLEAGELYEQAGLGDSALAAYQRYVRQFPEPLETAVETRFKIAGLYKAAGDETHQREQLKEIVKIDAAVGDKGTDRIRYLAAQSALVLTEDLYRRFAEVALVQPFDANLQKKQRRMDAALAAFAKLVDYEVGDVTAAATFYMAEVYADFSKSLIESERPSGLAAAEMQDYDDALEEEAYPFEERAISVHEKNLELMAAGVYNRWIEKSLDRLAVLMPGRYAKFEESTGLLASVDTYAYRAPNAGNPQVDGDATEDPTRASDPAVPAAPAPDSGPGEAPATENDQHAAAAAAAG